MQIADRIRESETAARRYPFVRQIIKIDETYYSVKYRLTVAPDLFIQLYFNERSGTAGLVLVYRRERLYGRDCESGGWHCHPIEDPAVHDASPEGRRAVSVDEFLGEVQDILVRENLI
jgi:hypothetical protein